MKTKQRLIIALDESNYWMKYVRIPLICKTELPKHPNRFSTQRRQATDEEKQVRNQPFWTLMCSTITTSSRDIALLIAGTHIGIQSEYAIISATLKSGEERSAKLITVSNFK